MSEKKKLKKLTLRKEEIVNLNDYEMNVVQGGGSSLACVTAVSAFSIAGYSLGKEESWWNCDHSKQANCMSAVSEKLVWTPGGIQCCEIEPIEIRAYPDMAVI
ncbi:MAG: class I lanthipeptide [Dysgonamonadaceae bacterium]|jgi:natural product precursor|nr:class I lanthipeptide [Dysgonamonadaceae bacterium]